MAKLYNHLLGRLRNPDEGDNGIEYSPLEHGEIEIVNGRLYEHKTLRVHYTTYDLRRDYDLINPSKQANVMSVGHDIDISTGISDIGHPFLYAQVLKIFHADIFYTPPGSKPSLHSMEFLFVRWYRQDKSIKTGFQQRRLHRLSFIPTSDSSAFGFLNPDDVVRASHIIPAWSFKRTDEYLTGATLARPKGEPDDWARLYINWYVPLLHNSP